MRVVVADDTALLRHGLARLLAEAGITTVGEACDATELLALVAELHPDVAIVDIRMPPTHTDEGLVAAAAIRRAYPAVGVLVLSQYVEADYALRLLAESPAGSGYLIKDRVLHPDELVNALERVAAGDVVIDRQLVDSLVDRKRGAGPLDRLTKREREILGLVAEGLTDRGIGERLWLTPKTVETHIRHILQKLALPTGAAHNRRVHAVLTYLRS